MDVLKLNTFLLQDAAAEPSAMSITTGDRIGGFEFVIVIVVLSFLFKIVKLHYESRDINSSSTPVHPKPAVAAINPNAGELGKQSGAKRSYVWWILGGLILIGMSFLMLFSLAVTSYVHHASVDNLAYLQPPIVSKHLAPIPPVAEAGPVEPNTNSNVLAELSSPQKMPTRSDDPDGFIADQYPSIADCGGPMALKIYNEISGKITGASGEKALEHGELEDPSLEADTGFNQFYLVNVELSDSDYIPFLIAFRKQMQSKLKECLVKDFTAEKSQDLLPPPRQFLVVVGSLQNKDGGEVKPSSGTLVCKLQGGELAAEVLTNFVEKKWINDFKAFAATRPDKNYLVGHGDELLPDESQAMKCALDSLDAKAYQKGQKRLWIGNRAYDVADSFRQKYERPYGEVFRTSVLLEQVPNLFGLQANTLVTAAKNSRPSFEWFVALLIALTVVVGAISNMLTQGYYRIEISRTVYVAVAIGTCALIIFVGMAVSDFVYISVFYGIFAFVVILVLASLDRAKKF